MTKSYKQCEAHFVYSYLYSIMCHCIAIMMKSVNLLLVFKFRYFSYSLSICIAYPQSICNTPLPLHHTISYGANVLYVIQDTV